MTILTQDYIKSLLPKRSRDCNKGNFGKLLCIASCRDMSGAAVLASRAALRSGAGIVYAASASSALLPLKVSTPEAIGICLSETKDGRISYKNADSLIKTADGMTAAVIGCGLSVCKDTTLLLKKLLPFLKIPTVIDADGINIIASDINILKNTCAPVILTPHIKEMSRLTGYEVSFIKENKEAVAKEFSKKHSVTLVLKDYQTVISTKDGEIFKNLGGHPSMAKGGSGDMLSGMIGAFLASGLSPADAAVCGVFVHSLAGEYCGERMGAATVLTTDMIEALTQVFKALE